MLLVVKVASGSEGRHSVWDCGLTCHQSAVALLLSACLTSFPFFCFYTPSSSSVLVFLVFLLAFLLCQQDTKSSPLLPPDLFKTLADFEEEEEELVFSKPPDFFRVSAGPLSSAPGANMFVCTQTSSHVHHQFTDTENTFKRLRLEKVGPKISSRLSFMDSAGFTKVVLRSKFKHKGLCCCRFSWKSMRSRRSQNGSEQVSAGDAQRAELHLL